MKSAHAWVACSLVSASFVFVSCGSDDGKKKAVISEGGTGTGGGAGEPAVAAGGRATTPMIPVTEAGAGGAPPIVVSSGGAGGAVGSGGEGGQPAPPLCFDLLDQSAGGAGQSVGGAAGAPAVPPAQPAFRFRCDDLNVGYVLGADQNPTSFTFSLKQGAGLLPATGGHFTFKYNWYDGETEQTVCSDQPSALVGENGVLQIPTDPTHPLDSLRITSLSVTDECNNEISLDASGVDEPTSCFLPQIVPQNGSWFIQCYEGFGTDCDSTCPVP